jgi:hypothetical protein
VTQCSDCNEYRYCICSRQLYKFFSLFDFYFPCVRIIEEEGRRMVFLYIRYTTEPPGVDSCDYHCCILPQSGDCDRAEQPRSALAKRLQPRQTVSPTEQSFVFVAACFFLFTMDHVMRIIYGLSRRKGKVLIFRVSLLPWR